MNEKIREAITPEERVNRMRDLLEHALNNDFANVDVLGGFIDYYNEHEVPDGKLTAFFESLDFPEHDFEFGEPEFDDTIIPRYDELGGPRDRESTWQRQPVADKPGEQIVERPTQLNEHFPLADAVMQQSTSMRLPSVVHAKLQQLATDLKYVKANQKDIVGALIAYNGMSDTELAALVTRYREETVGEFLDQNPELAGQ